MSDILKKIVAVKHEEVASARRRRSMEAMRADAESRVLTRDFVGALRRRIDAGQAAVIAEVKKASPSKGVLREDFEPADIAQSYAEGDGIISAACLSVLTDTPSFQGKPDYLTQARDACSLPVLRKDFLFEPYQVFEARAWGADCILVIMACLDDDEAQALVETAHDLGMDVLVEVHDEAELTRAIPLGTRLVGINNRNLKTFEVSFETAIRLGHGVPEDRIAVAESGISGHADVVRLGQNGLRTVLVGESLMRQDDVTAATRHLLFGDA